MGFHGAITRSGEDEIPLMVVDNDPLLDGFSDYESAPRNSFNARRKFAQPSTLSRWAACISSLARCRHAHCIAQPMSPRAILCRYVRRPFWGMVILLGLLNVASICLNCFYIIFADDFDDQLDGWLLPNDRLSALSTSRGVPISRCHSHNDYWQDVPLYSALRAGCIGVEADIWLSDGDLLVGHNPFILNRRASLQSLYLNPLQDILHRRNAWQNDLNLPDEVNSSHELAGVFAADPAQTLVLLIDFKTDGDMLWPYVMEQLQPLREAGYLTFYNGTTINERPITVVASGDAPVHRVMANDSYRDIFYDAPLDRLALPRESDHGQIATEYGLSNSYYASVNFRNSIGSIHGNRFSQDQLALIRSQIQDAHSRGLKVRYWGTPTWPRGLRNHVWHILVREGVDLVNVDDLREGTRQDWRKHRSWLL